MAKVMLEIPADAVPPIAAERLPGGAVPGMRYRLTVEEIADEAAKLAALKADIAAGLADAASGRVEPLDIEGLLTDLRKSASDKAD